MNRAHGRPGIISLALFLSGFTASVAQADAAPAAAAPGPTRCATFGPVSVPACDNHPDWTTGNWQPPAGAASLHVLVVGGGGGGAASIERGIGGTGGASGRVLAARLHAPDHAVTVSVGSRGRAGAGFRVPGLDGGTSLFDTLAAAGGQGGQQDQGGGAFGQNAGDSGGGGAGGGTYQANGRGGQGGQGGRAGTGGRDGAASTDADPVQGTLGGAGMRFPLLDFHQATVSAGKGGLGGQPGAGRIGYGGGGGGGGGGVLIGRSPAGAAGWGYAQAGAGGGGFGAGGGGGGNDQIGSPGGAGAPGAVYIEWADDVVASRE